MKKHILIFVIFFLLAIVITFPLVLHLSDYVFGKGDELLITWIMNWNIHSLLTNPLNLFQTNIFYPYQYTLAFSDFHFTSSLIGFLPFLITREPMVVYNINVIAAIVCLGFFSYLLVYFITKNIFSSFISGLLISFSPFILGRLFQLQVVSIYWIPLSLLFFLRFLKKYSTKNFFFFCLFFILQIANSFLPGYFIIFSCLAILIFYAIKQQLQWKKIFRKKIFAIILVTFLITFTLAYPYFKTSETFNYKRDIRDTIHFANRPEYFFYPNNKTRLQEMIKNIIYKNDKGPYKYDGYWGFGILSLALFSIIFFKKIYNKKNALIFLIIAISSFVLSLGPAWQWQGKVVKLPFIIPLPYAAFYYLVPGFAGFRNSARWEVLSVFAMSIFIGIVTSSLLKKRSILFSFLFTFFVGLIVLVEINWPFSYVSVPKTAYYPQIHQYLNTLPHSSRLLFLPIYPWYMSPYSNIEFERELFSTLHYKKMVNGYSGFSPVEWENMAATVNIVFPDFDTIKYLKKIGITHIIINKNEYSDLYKNNYLIRGKSVKPLTELIQEVQKFPELKAIKQIDENIVYQLISK